MFFEVKSFLCEWERKERKNMEGINKIGGIFCVCVCACLWRSGDVWEVCDAGGGSCYNVCELIYESPTV